MLLVTKIKNGQTLTVDGLRITPDRCVSLTLAGRRAHIVFPSGKEIGEPGEDFCGGMMALIEEAISNPDDVWSILKEIRDYLAERMGDDDE